MKKEMLKVDLRQADNNDMVVLAHMLLSVSRLFSSAGYKVQIKKTHPKPFLATSEKLQNL